MYTVKSIETLCENIISYNVPKDFTTWDAATTYSKGDEVAADDCGSTIYRSTINSNLGLNPEHNPDEWVAVGVSNYFAMFDAQNTSQTENPESIEIEIEYNELVNAAALVNCYGVEARFEVWEDNGTTKIFDKTVSLRDYGVPNMYDFYYSPIAFYTTVSEFNIPSTVTGKGKLTITNPNGIAKIGSLIYGAQFKVGRSVYGLDLDFKDYSTKVVDELTGAVTNIVDRGYSDIINYTVLVENIDIERVRGFRNSNKTKPTLWVADITKPYTQTYGYFSDFRINLEHPAHAECSVKIEGLS